MIPTDVEVIQAIDRVNRNQSNNRDAITCKEWIYAHVGKLPAVGEAVELEALRAEVPKLRAEARALALKVAELEGVNVELSERARNRVKRKPGARKKPGRKATGKGSYGGKYDHTTYMRNYRAGKQKKPAAKPAGDEIIPA